APQLVAGLCRPDEWRLSRRVPRADLDVRHGTTEVRHRQERLQILAQGDGEVVLRRDRGTLEVQLGCFDVEEVTLQLGETPQEVEVALVCLEAESLHWRRIARARLGGEPGGGGDLLRTIDRRR